MLFLRLLVALSFTAVLAALITTMVYALKMRTQSTALASHRVWAKISVWCAIMSIIITEIMVRINGGIENKLFTYFHLAFAIPFFAALMLAYFWFTGVSHARTHRILSYVCVGTYLATFVTGLLLLSWL